MYTGKTMLAALLGAAFGAGAALAQSPNLAPKLGKAITEADLQAWDISIMPDGRGLPAGNGSPAQGAKIYAEKCVACHAEGRRRGGAPGAGPPGGGAPLTNAIQTPTKIPHHSPYPPPLFHY